MFEALVAPERLSGNRVPEWLDTVTLRWARGAEMRLPISCGLQLEELGVTA